MCIGVTATSRRASHSTTSTRKRYTVLEIVTGDAPGLLYRISRAISDCGCDVDLVLISTEGRKAIDVLHVTKQGRKLDEDDQLELKQALGTNSGGNL